MIKEIKGYRNKYRQHYGIEFGKEYVIHHIDGDRSNNDISNLLLLPLSLHSKYHEYKQEFIMNSNGEIELGLTYGQAMLRRMDLLYLENLLSVLKEIDIWIEHKHNADMGYSDAYYMFKGAAI